MEWGWYLFDTLISFLEMLTTCFFCSRLFGGVSETPKDKVTLSVWAAMGTAMLTVRELVLQGIPDFVPAITIFALYAIFICHAKIWIALLWSMVNYLLLGVIVLATDAILSLLMAVPVEDFYLFTDSKVICCVVVRILQILICEVILQMREMMPHKQRKNNTMGLIVIFAISILILTIVWRIRWNPTEDTIQYIVIFISMVILIFDFAMLIAYEMIGKEQAAKRDLILQNEIIHLQMQNQKEISEMYQEIRVLRHDMNAHLYAISGYLEYGEEKKAKDYLQGIIGRIQTFEVCQSGNLLLDSLIGTKTAVARKSGIAVQVEIELIDEIQIKDEHMVAVIGNLYDNAIEACLKMEEKEKRFITIKIKQRKQDIMIVIENSAAVLDMSESGKWRSTKRNQHLHGMGMKSV